MNILTCEFVECSEVFKDCPLAHDIFVNSDPDCSWGGNNRTMVTPNVLIAILSAHEEWIESSWDKKEAKQVAKVLKRLHKLPETMYIDLEN